MHILNLLKYFPPYPGGIENIASDLVEELAARGVDETVISHGSRSYRSRNGVRQVLSTSYGDLLYAPVAPSFPFKLFNELKRGRYDALHIHMPNVSAFWALCPWVDIPIVVHWHSDVVFPEDKKLCRAAYKGYALFERALLKKAAAIVPTSAPYLEHSLPLAEFREKCSVIPLGLDFSRMTAVDEKQRCEARKKWIKGGNSFLIASAGRFSHYKGFEYLIEAASLVDGVQFVIAGDGEMHGALAEIVRTKGLEDKVSLPGRVSDYDLHSLMAACDAFCLPSVERSEAFGVVLLEAMYYSRPLVTTAIKGSGTSWVNRDGETGLVVPIEDPQALATAVKKLMDSPELCLELGRKGRERLVGDFTIARTADSFYQLYAGLL